MGLDMMLYKLSKPTFTDNTSYFRCSDVESNHHLFCPTFFELADTVERDYEFFDMEKIKKDFNVNEDLRCCMQSYDSCGFSDKNKFFQIDRATLEEKYIYIETQLAYAVDMKEIAYQRKGLNDIGWGLLPENCSYSDNKDIVLKMVSNGGLSYDFINRWVDGCTVFYNWW